MVQVLPYVQTPLEQLSPYLSHFGESLGRGAGAYVRNKRDQSIIQQLQAAASGTAPGGASSDSQLYSLYSRLSPELQKTYEPFLQTQLKQQQAQNTENIKRETVTLENIEKIRGVETIINDLEGLKSYAGSTKIPFTKSFQATPYGINRSGAEKRAEIDPLAINLEGLLRELNTKGALSDKRFEELLDRIPNQDDSERAYQGKLNAFKKILKSLPSYGEYEKRTKQPQQPKTERPPLESFQKWALMFRVPRLRAIQMKRSNLF